MPEPQPGEVLVKVARIGHLRQRDEELSQSGARSLATPATRWSAKWSTAGRLRSAQSAIVSPSTSSPAVGSALPVATATAASVPNRATSSTAMRSMSPCRPSTACRCPTSCPYDEGVLIGGDTLGVAYHALSKIGLRPRDTVAVVGCGPVGLGFVRLLSFYGVRTIAAEVSPYRRDLALRVGAETRHRSLRRTTAWRRFARPPAAAASTWASTPAARDAGVNLALDATRDEGTFIFAGAGRQATINPWSQFLEKEVMAYGVWYFVDRDYYGLLDLYRQGLAVADLITHRFPWTMRRSPMTSSPAGKRARSSSCRTDGWAEEAGRAHDSHSAARRLAFRFDSLDVALQEIAGQGFDLCRYRHVSGLLSAFQSGSRRRRPRRMLCRNALRNAGWRGDAQRGGGLLGNPAAPRSADGRSSGPACDWRSGWAPTGSPRNRG